ncbi:hypothetical protein MES5069_180143 [Mesorhizobium escarrei]|uniref:Uncharacterized protein n=1 Tax=Mesorhizobium escarrei TaxID=666018 RepID=A0ABM9DML1_9HYPH|nr:hypothetical protein MES5069_180143 [Mesorhizobium escarrei]
MSAKAGTVLPVRDRCGAGVAMDTMDSFGKIAAPTRPKNDFNYETDCRAALAPLVDGLLDGRAGRLGSPQGGLYADVPVGPTRGGRQGGA